MLQSGVASVRVTNGGSGYTSAPAVTFAAAPAGGTTATGTAALRYGVASVDVTDGGSGYTSAPTVTFAAAPSGGTTAAGTAVLRYGVASVNVTNGGSGYTSAPAVTFAAAPSGGATAAGTAALRLSAVASGEGHERRERLHLRPHRDLFGPGRRYPRDRHGQLGRERLRSIPEPVLGAPNPGWQAACRSARGSGAGP